jgi:SAM-dependent methyltransferase
MPGRFYPQGFLRSVGGVYRELTIPCRYLGQEGGRLVFDLNHPLAGRDLSLGAEIVAIHPRQKERGGRCEDWLEQISSDGPGMQTRSSDEKASFFSEENFRRGNEQPDALFYRQPRLVHHLDNTARQEISRRYADLIRPGSQVLDLMGSWTSHLPESLGLGGLTVLGLNEEELRQNNRAAVTVVQDLNSVPQLSFAAASFDAVICTASVEYLINPLAIMSEIRRILQPGGLLAFAFSNRWFPPKAIHLWPDLHEFERLGLVAELFHATGGFDRVTTLSRRGLPRPADDPHRKLWLSDPVYMVWGFKV